MASVSPKGKKSGLRFSISTWLYIKEWGNTRDVGSDPAKVVGGIVGGNCRAMQIIQIPLTDKMIDKCVVKDKFSSESHRKGGNMPACDLLKTKKMPSAISISVQS